MVSLRKKFLSSVSRMASHAHSRSILPKCPSTRHIGHAILVSGLVGAAPLHGVSSLTAILDSAPGDEVDLYPAKCALRVLSTLGNVSVVPWLKGTAGLVLEIVDLLDVSCPWK